MLVWVLPLIKEKYSCRNELISLRSIGSGGGEAGGGGGEAPLNENLGGSVPPRFGPEDIGKRSRKLVCQNIPVSDLFTNRFTMVTLGEILFSRTFLTALSRFREANQLLPFFHFHSETCCFPQTQRRPLRLWEPSQMQSWKIRLYRKNEQSQILLIHTFSQ